MTRSEKCPPGISGRYALRQLCAASSGPTNNWDRPGAVAQVRDSLPGRTSYRRGMDDKQILAHIDELIKTEHELRAKVAAGTLSTDAEHEQLRATEEALDRCWDLLRQRRARKEFGENPDEAAERPAQEVEGYLQ